MITTLNKYEKEFLHFYQNKYNVHYIKIANNKEKVPTEVLLYTANKRKIKHNPTYMSVTVPNMFSKLRPNKLYEVNHLINEGSE